MGMLLAFRSSADRICAEPSRNSVGLRLSLFSDEFQKSPVTIHVVWVNVPTTVNMAEREFRSQGCTSRDFQCDSGVTRLVIIDDHHGFAVFGLIRKDFWEAIEWRPRNQRFAELTEHSMFQPICGFTVVKKGWLAVSSVQAVTVDGAVLNGQADKAFAQFVDDMFALNKVR